LLIVSLILIALLIIVERRFVSPWQARAGVVLKGRASSEDVMALVRNPDALFGRVAMIGLFTLLMVVRPQVNF
jgi:hypothetical protein